jgi:hypothetical protein
VSWNPGKPDESVVFVDGVSTAYNNSAFLLFKMATEPAYHLGWKTGERELLVVSVGTGSARGPQWNRRRSGNEPRGGRHAVGAESQALVDQDISCPIIGRCTYGGFIYRELHDLVPVDPDIPDQPLSLERDMNKAFLYVRYNAELTRTASRSSGSRGSTPTRSARWTRSRTCRTSSGSGRRLATASSSPISVRSRADEARVGDGHSPDGCFVASAAFDADAHSAVSRPTRFSSRSASITSGSSALA